MPEAPQLNHPWLVAVWPGMGNVAISAGYYLMSKLGMYQLSEFPARDLFDIEHVEVRHGLIRTGRLPRSRFFVWHDPKGRHDLVVFVGEAQPPTGKNTFCQRLIQYAQEIGVEKVFTFAAMATRMHPAHEARIFGAAADGQSLKTLKGIERVELLDDGQIGGLNGVALGAAAEAGLPGVCLLGEMPHIFAQMPFPKASLAVLEVFTGMADIDLDFTELAAESQAVEQRLGEVLANVEAQLGEQQEHEKADNLWESEWERDDEEAQAEEAGEDKVRQENLRTIRRLFEDARQDRSKAYELKRELDRLGLFREFEDEFLELFKKSGAEGGGDTAGESSQSKK